MSTICFLEGLKQTLSCTRGKYNCAVCLLALQHFSESIQEYLANLDQAPDPTVRKDTFSNEIFSAYEVLFNSWLQHREAKVGGRGAWWDLPGYGAGGC